MLDFYNINLNCEKTWNIFSEGKTKGVFQLESNLGRAWSKRVKPSNLEELSALIALIRPGCLKAMSGDPPKSMTQRYVDRKLGLEPVTYFHSSLEPILGPTYGVLVYQEQAMQIAQTLAGFDLQEADVLRKAIGKKKADIMAQVKDSFLKGADSKGVVTKEESEEIFSWIQESQRYSFNKSHAVSYAKNAYWSAYCKAHFPHEFFCSYLRGSEWKQDSHEEVYELVNDAKIHDITVATPDLRDLRKHFYIKEIKNDPVIRFGMVDIKGVGSNVIDKISGVLSELGQELTWKIFLEVLCAKKPLISNEKRPKIINITAAEAIICSGAIDFLHKSRQEMLYEFNMWNKLTEKEQGWIVENCKEKTFLESLKACQPTKKLGGGASNVKRSDILLDIISMIENPPHTLEDTSNFIAIKEEKLLGASINSSRADYRSEDKVNTSCKEFLDGKNGYMVFGVEIKRVNTYKIKKGRSKGQNMAFLTVGDSSCAIDDVVCFSEEWLKYQNLLQEENVVVLIGERDKKKGSLIVKRVLEN